MGLVDKCQEKITVSLPEIDEPWSIFIGFNLGILYYFTFCPGYKSKTLPQYGLRDS